MRDRPDKNHRSRRDPAASTAGRRPRPDHPKEPHGNVAVKEALRATANAKPRPTLRKRTPPSDGGEQKPNFTEAASSCGEDTGARIAKVMARAGLCSRRDAEVWIGEGRVALNGVVITNPAVNVRNDDKITVDGEPLAQRSRTRLFMFHKPRGLVTTERDPEGRPTIFDYLREHWPEGPRVVSIGRLDINTEGLLLLTNDGGLARILELPATGWARRYRVRAKGETDQSILDQLRQGLTLEGVTYAGIEATLDRVQGANCWLTMALREGKNREIKRVLEHIGLEVNRLIRLSFGPFQLGEIAEGAVDEVPTRVLRDQLGPTLAKAAGADFLSPLHDETAETKPIEVLSTRQPRSSAGSARDHADPARRKKRPETARPRGSERPTEERVEPKVKPPPRQRKHISALRAEHGDEPHTTRKRIERHETADRKGRTVRVERLVTVQEKKQTRSKASAARSSRNLEDGRKKYAKGAAPTSKMGRDSLEKPQRTRWPKSSEARQEKTSRPQGSAKPWQRSEEKTNRTPGEGRPMHPQGRKHVEGPRAPGPKGKTGQGRPGGGKPDRRGGPGHPRSKS
jgi:23S rRNA pseudouridine2605 synthase